MTDDISTWDSKWKGRRLGTGNHSKTNLYLIEYYDWLKAGREASQVRVLVPLCGMSVDMKWLYDKGHTIVGVEAIQQPVEYFFNQNSIAHHKSTSNCVEGNVIIYESNDGRLKVFVCDFFKFNVGCAGLMDAVWDRGSIVAIQPKMRLQYIELMKSLLASNFKYLLQVAEYDPSEWHNPPYLLKTEEVNNLFYGFDVQLLKRCPVKAEDCKGKWSENLTWYNCITYLIQEIQ